MEVQIIQACTQITFVRSPRRCEDCEEEERQEALLQKDIAQDWINLSQASLKLAENSSFANPNTENDLATESEGGIQTLKASALKPNCNSMKMSVAF